MIESESKKGKTSQKVFQHRGRSELHVTAGAQLVMQVNKHQDCLFS